MDTICLQCGNKGITNAFVYCVRCLDFAVHRYCLDAIPATYDEYVPWYCGCEVKRKIKTAALKHDVIPCQTGVHEVSEGINGVSGVTKEKSHKVVVKIEPEVCEDYWQPLCNVSAQLDLIKRVESNESSPTEFRKMNDKHEKIKGQQPNTSQQLEEENNDNLIKCASSTDEISSREMVNINRIAIFEPSMEKDHNRLVKDIMDYILPAKVKKSDDTLMKCASLSDDISLKEMVNKKRSAMVEPSVEKDQNRLVKDVKDCTIPSIVKKSEKRDHRYFSQNSHETENEPGAGEHPVVSCYESFRSSKKMKTTISTEANLEEQRQGTAAAQIHSENRGAGLETQCFDVITEGRGIAPRNNHLENINIECGEEKPGLHHANNLLKQFPDSATMVPILDGHRRPEPIISPVWRGSFNILHKEHDILNGLMAHLSTNACQKVYEEAHQLQHVLHLQILPKSDIWPKSFQISEPSAENIALYFFPTKTSERSFDHLVDKMIQEELGMRAIVQNAELLVFPSNELPLGYWMFHSKYYLWGVFRAKRPTPAHSQSNVGESVERIGIPADLPNWDKTLVTSTKNSDSRSPESPRSNSYCLDAIPDTFDGVCDGCEVEKQNKSTALEHYIIPCKTGVHEVSEPIDGVSGVVTEKSSILVVKIDAQDCKDFPRQLCDGSAQPDVTECAESSENFPMEFRETNIKHEETKGRQPNSSQQHEAENNENLPKHVSVSKEVSVKELVNNKRSTILESSVEKDHNRLANDITAEPAKVKKSETRDRFGRSFSHLTETDRGTVEHPTLPTPTSTLPYPTSFRPPPTLPYPTSFCQPPNLPIPTSTLPYPNSFRPPPTVPTPTSTRPYPTSFRAPPTVPNPTSTLPYPTSFRPHPTLPSHTPPQFRSTLRYPPKLYSQRHPIPSHPPIPYLPPSPSLTPIRSYPPIPYSHPRPISGPHRIPPTLYRTPPPPIFYTLSSPFPNIAQHTRAPLHPRLVTPHRPRNSQPYHKH